MHLPSRWTYFRCEACHKFFLTKHNLDLHTKHCITCSKCGKLFSGKRYSLGAQNFTVHRQNNCFRPAMSIGESGLSTLPGSVKYGDPGLEIASDRDALCQQGSEASPSAGVYSSFTLTTSRTPSPMSTPLSMRNCALPPAAEPLPPVDLKATALLDEVQRTLKDDEYAFFLELTTGRRTSFALAARTVKYFFSSHQELVRGFDELLSQGL